MQWCVPPYCSSVAISFFPSKINISASRKVCSSCLSLLVCSAWWQVCDTLHSKGLQHSDIFFNHPATEWTPWTPLNCTKCPARFTQYHPHFSRKSLVPYVTTMISSSLSGGLVLSTFDSVWVIALLKKPTFDTTNIANYSHVSDFTFLFRTTVCAVFRRLSSYLQLNDLLDASVTSTRQQSLWNGPPCSR